MLQSIGIRAHDFGKMSSDKLARVTKENGLGSVQLALAKAIEGIENPDQDLSEDQVLRIGKSFEDYEVLISVLGCYLNYAGLDAGLRRGNLSVFKKHVDYLPLLKGKVVGTETGSLNDDYSWHPDNHTDRAYLTFAKSLEEILTYAQDKKVMVAVEPVYNHIIYSNKVLKRLIDDMQSDYLDIILDPVNLLHMGNHDQVYDVMEEAFDLYGDRIHTLHVKDYNTKNKRINEIPHGHGLMDYKKMMDFVHKSKEPIDVLLENADVNALDQVIGSLR